jgi:hypothetical protein
MDLGDFVPSSAGSCSKFLTDGRARNGVAFNESARRLFLDGRVNIVSVLVSVIAVGVASDAEDDEMEEKLESTSWTVWLALAVGDGISSSERTLA